MVEFISLDTWGGFDHSEWYLRSIVTALAQKAVEFPWEAKPAVERKPMTREERRADIRASRDALAEEIKRGRTGVR